MRSMFVSSGIHNPRDMSWMGQVTTTSTGTGTKTDDNWGKDLATVITAGSTAFTSYEKEQIAEENRKAEEQKRATAEANTRTAQIQQQTTGMQLNSGTKIMGLEKPVFYLGAAVILAALIGGGFVLMKKD